MKNRFGGGNANSLYVPMSEIEQEVISRLVEAGDLQVFIVGWGYVSKPRITFGDARVQIVFRMNFDRPAVPMPVHYFDLELRTGSGQLLFKDRQSTMYDNKPIQVAAGMFLDLVWDIAIRNMDPALVKQVLPKATGLTSRLQDKDTGAITLLGNMRLKEADKKLLRKLRQGEAEARIDTALKAAKAIQKASGK